MKITLTKNKAFLWLFLILIVLVSTLVVYSKTDLFKNSYKYSNLLEICDLEEGLTKSHLVCKGFLEDENLGDDGLKCLSVLIPYESNETETVEICENKETINWENPYTDYSLSIPVILEFDYNRLLFWKSGLQRITVNLMEDEEALELLGLVNIPGSGEHIGVITQQQAKIEERGWYVTNKFESESSDKVVENLFVVESAEIDDYSVGGDDIVFNMTSNLNGKDITFDVRTEEFVYAEVASSGEEEFLIVNKNDISLINLDSSYYIQILLLEKDFFTEEFIEGILDGEGLSMREDLVLELMLKLQ